MRREFRHYREWEDWVAGLYRIPDSSEQADAVLAASLLADQEGFHRAATDMVTAWPVAALVNLSHVARNRQAWIGQATCCWALGVPETITKLGWHLLTPEVQVEANTTADRAIADWERRYLASRPTEWEKYVEREVA